MALRAFGGESRRELDLEWSRKMNLRHKFSSVRNSLVRLGRAIGFLVLYRKYRAYTMASRDSFWRNMVVVDGRRHVRGCIVECGVWRGGMSAGMAEVLGPDREYFLFDSFEGLPPATELDGEYARDWQKDTQGATYFDNCRAPIEFADQAMKLSGASSYRLVKGWFENTLPPFEPPSPIAVLRLDGDWYESTMTALESLFKYLARDGIVILDDYHTWDGCSRAVHDFLSRHQLTARISQKYGVCILEPRS
jgi:O-methyltransferase